jgi:hypothetical protein
MRSLVWEEMMESESQDIAINVPEDEAIGHYANFVGVWHTPHEFAIDFCVVQPFLLTGPSAKVVSRVRIPPTIVFDLLRTLNQNLTEYERTFGEIKRPEMQEEGGDDEPST